MYKSSVAVLIAVISLGYGSITMAREHGGQNGNTGGAAAGHMSDQGKDNTNAQWSGHSAKGQNRSDTRSGDHQGHGQGHGQHHGKGKGHGQGHEKH